MRSVTTLACSQSTSGSTGWRRLEIYNRTCLGGILIRCSNQFNCLLLMRRSSASTQSSLWMSNSVFSVFKGQFKLLFSLWCIHTYTDGQISFHTEGYIGYADRLHTIALQNMMAALDSNNFEKKHIFVVFGWTIWKGEGGVLVCFIWKVSRTLK